MKMSSVLCIRLSLSYPQISNQTPRAYRFSVAIILPAVLLHLNLEMNAIVFDHVVSPTVDEGPNGFLHRAFFVR